jgi:hypothetical protein
LSSDFFEEKKLSGSRILRYDRGEFRGKHERSELSTDINIAGCKQTLYVPEAFGDRRVVRSIWCNIVFVKKKKLLGGGE